MTNSTINLGLKQKKEDVFYVLQLSHNERWELFFRPLLNQKASGFYDGTDRTDIEIKNMDHISFHEDGLIHFRIKDGNGYKDKIHHQRLNKTIKSMPESYYMHLLTYSIYDFSLVKQYMSKSNPLKFRDSKNVMLHYEFENLNKISLVFFLLGAYVDPKTCLESHFSSVLNPTNSIYLDGFLVNRNDPSHFLSLLVAYTDKVIPQPPLSAISDSKKFKQSTRIENPLGISLVCSDSRVRDMV